MSHASSAPAGPSVTVMTKILALIFNSRCLFTLEGKFYFHELFGVLVIYEIRLFLYYIRVTREHEKWWRN